MYSEEQYKLAELMLERNISKLYVEVYKKPTGFNSVHEMKEHIIECNKILGDREEEIENMLYCEVMKKMGAVSTAPSTITIKQYYQQLINR